MGMPTGSFLQLRRDTTLLYRRDGSIQLGWNPEQALLLRPPTGVDGHALAHLLNRCRDGLDFDDIVTGAGEIGLTSPDIATIVGDLTDRGLMTRRRTVGTVRSVRVHGRGPLSDLIWSGLRRLGRTSQRARSHRAGPDISRWTDDLVVLADDAVVDPHLVGELLIAGIPHLQVRLRDGRGVVGPLVVPGRTSCLRCADLTRRDHDDEWPYLAAQLLGQVGYARPATVAATAALALDQIDAGCSGTGHRQPAVFSATLELDLEAHCIDRRPWPPHADCDCAHVPESHRAAWLDPAATADPTTRH